MSTPEVQPDGTGAGPAVSLTTANLAPTRLPVTTAAIDRKNVPTLHWHDLCRVLELDPNTAKPKQVKKRSKKEFPNVQLCIPKEGEPYALGRVHSKHARPDRAPYLWLEEISECAEVTCDLQRIGAQLVAVAGLRSSAIGLSKFS